MAEEGADLARIENEIKTMPNYFADYDTTVHFISQEELDRDHSGTLTAALLSAQAQPAQIPSR